MAELEPLKEKALTLQAEVESKEHNVRLLQEDNERWKTRNQTILAKYERIDPEELSILKNAAAEANAHLERAQEQIAALTAEVAGKAHLVRSYRVLSTSTALCLILGRPNRCVQIGTALRIASKVCKR